MPEKIQTHMEMAGPAVPRCWYAIQTRARHEKIVASQLERDGIETFLPLCSRVHIWSDRRKVIDLPLFSSYVFVHTSYTVSERVHLLRTRGVVGFVGPRKEATSIPADQIERVRSVIRANAQYGPVPYLAAGQRVRIRSGALHGLEGILLRVADDHSLVLSIDLIQKSIAVRLCGYEVETVGSRPN